MYRAVWSVPKGASVLLAATVGVAVMSATLVHSLFELVVIALAVLIVNLISLDGKSNWYEGAQLLIAYAIIAIAFFLHD